MTTYGIPKEETTFQEATKVARAMKNVARNTGIPRERCAATVEAVRKADIPDLPARSPEWRQTLGRRACRQMMAGLEPSHWQGPDYKNFRRILELLVLTNTAQPDQLWNAAVALLKRAAQGEPVSAMESRIRASGIAGTSHSWTLNDIRDSPELATLILESAYMAVDAWPAYYRSPHPDRLMLVLETSGMELSEMQCEYVCVTAMMEEHPGHQDGDAGASS